MIDLIDQKLLYELNWNCRQNHTILGKKLRQSKQVIRYRINQLEKQGLIKSYHALIDWRKLGYNSIRVYLKWKNINPILEKEVYDYLKKDPFFMWTVKFEGEFDIAFYLWVKSIPEFAEKWSNFLHKYRKYMLKHEIYESVNMVHYPMKLLQDKSLSIEKTIGNGSSAEYDEIDYDILKLITKNAKISIIDLAKTVNLTSKAVIYRLKNLEKNGILLGYNALIDTDKLGYSFYKIDFYLNDLSRINEMNEYAKSHKNIVYLMRTIGGPDFEIEVMVNSAADMKKIIEDIRIRFSEAIDFYRFHRFEYTIKQVYLPGVSLGNE